VSTNQKSVPLWSVGLRWNVDREKFYKVAWLPRLSLTMSHGYNGNLDRATTGISTFRYVNSARLTNLPYAVLSNIGNPDLRWEKIGQQKWGIEFATKAGRISGTIEHWRKNGIDLIGTTTFPPSAGVLNYRGNYSTLRANGWDIQLNTVNARGKVGWTSHFLFSAARDKVTEYDIQLTNNQILAADGLNGKGIVPIEGKPVFSVYSLRFTGLDPQTGDPVGDLNGTASKDYTELLKTDIDNLVYHGPGNPTIFGSVINRLRYGDFSIAFTLSLKAGYYFRRNTLNYATLLGESIVPHKDFTERWTAPGDESWTNVPSMTYPVDRGREDFYRFSSVLVEKGDHIRLQDILLDYRFSKFGQIKMDKPIHVYAQITNLGVIWKATKSGLDPDLVPSHPGSYRRPLSFSIGIRTNF
jgi:hypothetical protein